MSLRDDPPTFSDFARRNAFQQLDVNSARVARTQNDPAQRESDRNVATIAAARTTQRPWRVIATVKGREERVLFVNASTASHALAHVAAAMAADGDNLERGLSLRLDPVEGSR